MEAKKEDIYRGVSDFYAQLIEKAREGRQDGCACVTGSATAHAERIGYSRSDLESVPRDAAGSSFGCGNPVAFAEVRPGETVLDLGSGAGIDCFLAAQRVGASGRVIGLDMTREMVARARAAAVENGYPNVEFRLGRMEEMPVESRSVDWVISNCVINLSPDKEKVFAEAHRVLKPGGRLLVSDMVAENIPDSIREDISAWASCIAGAVSEQRYLEMIREAGFSDVEVLDRVDYAPRTGSGPTAVASIRVRGVKRSQTQREESVMKASQTGLDRQTQLLVAAGAAVAAGCIPCLQTIVEMARAEGIEERKLKEAAMTGQYVKEQPNGMMKKFSDELLGTHLQSRQPATGGECPLSGKPLEGSQPGEPVTQGGPGSCGCGCK